MKKLLLLFALAVVAMSCGNHCPSNEIWYTSADGNIVEPYSGDGSQDNFTVFGANIVSNKYDVDKDCWVIKFDGDITAIGYAAFCACSNLTSVTIPDSVTTIGLAAFCACSNLTSVTIPDSVTTIGERAFQYCDSLTAFDGKCASEDGRCLIIDGTLNSFAPAGLAEYTIPDSVTAIGNSAFYGCSSLTEFNGKYASEDGRCLIIDGVLNSFAPAGLTEYTIPDSVTTIGDWVFQNCSSLTSVTIPDSVTTIGEGAFYGCSSLTSVTIPDSVTSIGDEAFYECSSLTNVTIPDSVTEIGWCAFYNCDSLTSVTIPDSVTTIGYFAFYYCSSLTSITIPDSVTSIGNEAFSGCSSLTSITIPDSVTTIGDVAFADCSSLTSVTIPDSVTTIGYFAFCYCSSLTSITIPDSVTSIGDEAFSGCSNLTSVYCKAVTPPAVELLYDNHWFAFDNNASDRKIYVPTESVEAYKSASGWRDYADAIVGYDF